jgi:hypothetical protein
VDETQHTRCLQDTNSRRWVDIHDRMMGRGPMVPVGILVGQVAMELLALVGGTKRVLELLAVPVAPKKIFLLAAAAAAEVPVSRCQYFWEHKFRCNHLGLRTCSPDSYCQPLHTLRLPRTLVERNFCHHLADKVEIDFLDPSVERSVGFCRSERRVSLLQ